MQSPQSFLNGHVLFYTSLSVPHIALTGQQKKAKDELGNLYGLSWLGINDTCGVFALTGIRNQSFPVLRFDLLGELLVFQIYEELTLVLEGKAAPVLKSEFDTILAEFKTRYSHVI